jgi:DNA-binding CsgD family transcriptional regulator/PAS domain-containing protein
VKHGENEFLDLLYGTALQPDLWIPVMERFADMIGGTSGLLSSFDQTNGTGPNEIARIDPAMPAIYANHFAGLNPFTKVPDRRVLASTWTLSMSTDEDRMPKEALLRTEYYNDFLKPQAIHSTLMIRLGLQGAAGTVLSIQRPEERGQFSRRDLEIAAYYHPHLIRAFNLSQKLAIDRALGQGLAAVFDCSAQGLFLLDETGLILRANPVGEALLAREHGLSAFGGRLSACNAGVARQLRAMVAVSAEVDPERRSAGSMAIPRPDGSRPLSLAVAPLRAEAGPVILSRPCVLVCVTDPDAGLSLSERRLTELFGLTQAERRLALALFEGATLQQAAAKLGISVNTAGVQLSRIFEKTGVNRQSTLVALLTRSAGPDLAGT